MEPALSILRKALQDAGIMQLSIASTAYCNSLQLAIRVLENYDKVLQKTIQSELEKTT